MVGLPGYHYPLTFEKSYVFLRIFGDPFSSPKHLPFSEHPGNLDLLLLKFHSLRDKLSREHKNWNALQKRWILLHTCFPYNNHLIIKGCFNAPLEHTFGTPKPLPTGYEGIPFIVGWGGCLRCALLVLCNFFGNSCLSQLAKTIILSAANRKVQRASRASR